MKNLVILPNFIRTSTRYLLATLLLSSTSLISFGQAFDFESEAPGATGTLSNGWICSPTSDFRWSADNDGTGSGGTGPAVDHTLGTSAGIYMYTEASFPASTGDIAFLESPTIDISSFTYPSVSFWYHKAGSDMGDLFVDVFDGTSWVMGVASIIGSTQSDENSPWLRYTVNLSAFSGSIKVRFRAICGSGFESDMAIDDIEFFELPEQDLALDNAMITPFEYVQYPASQVGSLSFQADVTNLGAIDAVNAELKVSVGTWSDSSSVALLAPLATTPLSVGSLSNPGIGSYEAIFETSSDITETENLFDNRDTLTFAVSDSVYAKENGINTGSLGIGPGTPGIIGQTFDIVAPDLLTSVTFFLNSPTIGDTTFVTLHSFSGVPGAVLATTNTLTIPTVDPGWYTLSFPTPVMLNPGTYFIGINEEDGNITLGTTNQNYQPNTGWVIFGTNPWQPSEFYGFPVTYLLRANFGPASITCSGDNTFDNAGGTGDGLWSTATNWSQGCVPDSPILDDISIDSNVNTAGLQPIEVGNGGSITIQLGATFTHDDADPLVISSGGSLINNGTLINETEITHTASTFSNTGTYQGAGVFTGSFQNNGTINISSN